ncbi:MAG TPA: mannose-6-phosphate isomerase, partial [Opitutaceae bacterium]|nr:mannose-6-phosphate isomerase [Opitutaceae bacterium]
ASCPEFAIRRVVLGPGEQLAVAAGEQPRLLSVVSGRLSIPADRGSRRHRLEHGENALLAYGGDYAFTADATAILLLTENFA